MSRSDNEPTLLREDLPPVFIDRTLALTRVPTIKGREYWLALRGDRAMPSRGEISPRDLRDILPYVGLTEVLSLPDGGVDYVNRLAGGRIEEVFGGISGKPIGATLPPAIVSRWRVVFEEVRLSKQPLAVSGRMGFDNLRHLKYELFIGPLGEGDTVRMMFGVLDIWPVT